MSYYYDPKTDDIKPFGETIGTKMLLFVAQTLAWILTALCIVLYGRLIIRVIQNPDLLFMMLDKLLEL
jgi:hypothetical protein